MADKPPVSVVIPVYNGERYLAEAIESVLAQTYRSFEVTVVDDGSTDQTRNIIKSYPELNYLYQANSGPAAAKNTGIRTAQGEFLSFLDADDIWMPDKLHLQMAEFDSDPELDIVSGLVEEFISPDVTANFTFRPQAKQGPFPGKVPGAMLIKRHLFERGDLYFDHEMRYGATFKWFTRVNELNLHIKVLPELVLKRRIHGNNVSIKFQKEKEKIILQSLKASLDRKRAVNNEEKPTE